MAVAVGGDDALRETAQRIAREIAATNADDVDRGARFPVETLAALREQGLLAASIPVELGGSGASLATIAGCCRELGRACGASAMVFAMHHIQILSIVRHVEPGSWFEGYLARAAAEQRLVASVTSEIGTGGDMSRSVAALEPGADGGLTLRKRAPTVSYGEYADDLLVSVRRGPEAEAGDQVAVLTMRGQHALEPTGTWDVLGMRGTCSPGYIVDATVAAEQVLPVPFATVASESMVPVSHILWSHLWLGIAEDAFDRSRAFVRAEAKRTPGHVPASAQRLSRLSAELSMLRAAIAAGLHDFRAWGEDAERERMSTMAAVLRFNNLKLVASEQAADVCRGALEVSGIMGFKNDTPFSVGRHLRDTMSAALMIANERLHHTNAGLLLVAKDV